MTSDSQFEANPSLESFRQTTLVFGHALLALRQAFSQFQQASPNYVALASLATQLFPCISRVLFYIFS